MMPSNVEEKIARLHPARRRKVVDGAAELLAEEMSLRELRKARRLTQAHLASELGISQDGISRLEQRSDLLLSTLRKTVEAMGGSLSLIARFPDRPARRVVPASPPAIPATDGRHGASKQSAASASRRDPAGGDGGARSLRRHTCPGARHPRRQGPPPSSNGHRGVHARNRTPPVAVLRGQTPGLWLNLQTTWESRRAAIGARHLP